MTGLAGSIALGGMLGKAKAVAGSIPWQVWAVAGALLLLGLGSCVHGHKVKAFEKDVIAANDTKWQKRLDQAHQEALDWKTKFEARTAAISQDIRRNHETTLRSNAALADDLRLHGPGAARCGADRSKVAAAAGGRDQAGGRPDAASGQMPAGEGDAVVPWGWLVTSAQQCDANRSEVLSWRELYARLPAAMAVSPAPDQPVR